MNTNLYVGSILDRLFLEAVHITTTLRCLVISIVHKLRITYIALSK